MTITDNWISQAHHSEHPQNMYNMWLVDSTHSFVGCCYVYHSWDIHHMSIVVWKCHDSFREDSFHTSLDHSKNWNKKLFMFHFLHFSYCILFTWQIGLKRKWKTWYEASSFKKWSFWKKISAVFAGSCALLQIAIGNPFYRHLKKHFKARSPFLFEP